MRPVNVTPAELESFLRPMRESLRGLGEAVFYTAQISISDGMQIPNLRQPSLPDPD